MIYKVFMDGIKITVIPYPQELTKPQLEREAYLFAKQYGISERGVRLVSV